jgi:hypothetical protein
LDGLSPSAALIDESCARVYQVFEIVIGQPSSGGHSGQVSPIEPRTLSTAAVACSSETASGGYWRAISMARYLACGSVRSFIQPCSSHSQMAPASSRMIAQPSIVRKAGISP